MIDKYFENKFFKQTYFDLINNTLINETELNSKMIKQNNEEIFNSISKKEMKLFDKIVISGILEKETSDIISYFDSIGFSKELYLEKFKAYLKRNEK